ncbi:TPA: hypothetical protein ACKP22_003259 [Pseudomonas putida]
MASLASQLSALTPRQRLIVLLLLAICFLAFAGIYARGYRDAPAADDTRLVTLDGRLTTHPQVWKPQPELVSFGVAYELDGQRYQQGLYAYRSAFEQARVGMGTVLRLTVEGSGRVRALANAEGRILFDDRLNQQVIEWNNTSIRRGVIVSGVMSAAALVFALLTGWRHRRRIFVRGGAAEG